MKPRDLIELGRLIETAPLLAEERLAELAAAAGQGRNARGKAIYVPFRSARDTPPGQLTHECAERDVELLLVHAGALEVKDCKSEAFDPAAAPEEMPAVLECPVDQTLACLRVLDKVGLNQAFSELLEDSHLLDLAQNRLAELLLTYPALVHPGFLYPLHPERADAEPEPLFMAYIVQISASVAIPVIGGFANTVPEERLRAWANHRAVTMGLTATTRGGRLGKTTFMKTFANAAVDDELLTSLFKLDRFRFDAMSDADKRAVPPGQAFSGLELQQSKITTNFLRPRLHDHLREAFRQSYELQAKDNAFLGDVLTPADRPEGDPAALLDLEGRRLIGNRQLLSEVAASPTYRAADHRDAFVGTASDLLEGVGAGWGKVIAGASGAPPKSSWPVVLRFQQMLAELVYVGAFKTRAQAAAAVAETAFRPEGREELDWLVKLDAEELTHDSALALVEAFGLHGVKPGTIYQLLASNDAPAAHLIAAAGMLRTQQSMRAELQKVATTQEAAPEAARRKSV